MPLNRHQKRRRGQWHRVAVLSIMLSHGCVGLPQSPDNTLKNTPPTHITGDSATTTKPPVAQDRKQAQFQQKRISMAFRNFKRTQKKNHLLR
ncbi:hypothetical protein ElyMa_001183900 [Elysia marginata]|uniref:Uncharacterized protein n=1 Tax=Elysia marginata TaxID=1093978 RepID=A0AAV4I6L0_9GAST|nr:hypothetical protein ElyMa_001183900 [Elysia marginata]